MQLDRVVIPAGLFNPARTFSLVRDDEGLYLIYTGKAMGYVDEGGGAAGALAGRLLDKMADKRAVEIEENERKLRASSAKVMATTKHSVFVPKSAIESIEVKGVTPDGSPVVVVKGPKKLKLHFQRQDEPTVRQFFAPLAKGQA